MAGGAGDTAGVRTRSMPVSGPDGQQAADRGRRDADEVSRAWEKEAELIHYSSWLVPAAEASEEGRWVTHACFFNCGNRCVNRSYVVDGKVLRQKTDDLHPDTPDYPQQRGCARGRALRQLIFGADRLKYPLKRKHWAPGGGDKELRGRDEWERVS